MRVILPGSYDPVTVGHVDVIRRAAEEYEGVFVVAFINPKKTYRFSPDERVEMLKLAVGDIPGVTVDYSEGLVVDYMREHGIEMIVKGYRNEADLKWEREQAEWNLQHGGYETRLIPCADGLECVSSTAVRQSLERGNVPSELLPEEVLEFIRGR